MIHHYRYLVETRNDLAATGAQSTLRRAAEHTRIVTRGQGTEHIASTHTVHIAAVWASDMAAACRSIYNRKVIG